MIRGMVPPDRLLEWTYEDGWEPLCKFLGKEVPSEPFPHANAAGGAYESRAEEFMQRKGRIAIRNLCIIVAVVVLLLAYVWPLLFRGRWYYISTRSRASINSRRVSMNYPRTSWYGGISVVHYYCCLYKVNSGSYGWKCKVRKVRTCLTFRHLYLAYHLLFCTTFLSFWLSEQQHRLNWNHTKELLLHFTLSEGSFHHLIRYREPQNPVFLVIYRPVTL